MFFWQRDIKYYNIIVVINKMFYILFSRFTGMSHKCAFECCNFIGVLKSIQMKIKLSFLKVLFSLHTDIRIGEANVSQKRLIVLADPWFLVMTRHIVPVHPIVVELIEDRKAIFGSATLNSLTIVGLRFTDTKKTAHIAQNRNRILISCTHHYCFCHFVSRYSRKLDLEYLQCAYTCRDY